MLNILWLFLLSDDIFENGRKIDSGFQMIARNVKKGKYFLLQTRKMFLYLHPENETGL